MQREGQPDKPLTYLAVIQIPGAPYGRFEFEYDSEGRLLRRKLLIHRATTGMLGNHNCTEYRYDAYGNEVENVYAQWDLKLKNWQLLSKTNSTYDEEHRLLLEEKYSFDSNIGEWEHSRRIEYTYDAAGNLVRYEQLIPGDSPGEWEKEIVYEYEYTPSGELKREIWYTCGSSSWLTDRMFEYEYDAIGNQIVCIEYERWRDDWLGKIRQSWDYNGDGNAILETWYVFDRENKTWNPYAKVDLEYNGILRASLTVSLWDESEMRFVPDRHEEFMYNSYDLLTTSFEFVWDTTSVDWIPDTRISYFYSKLSSNTGTLTVERPLRIFPNPTSDFLFVDTATQCDRMSVQFFDQRGIPVLSIQLRNREVIDVSQLPTGMYTCVVRCGADMQSTILVKR